MNTRYFREVYLLVVAFMSACSVGPSDEASGTHQDSTDTEAIGTDENATGHTDDETATSSPMGPDAASGTGTPAADTDVTPGGTGGGFIVEPDGGSTMAVCDLWSQDCPSGEKCVPWDSGGGTSWNSVRCAPLDEVADQPGDECTVTGSATSGIDSCAVSSMCWEVEGSTGTCVAFCEGAPESPSCADPTTQCVMVNNGSLNLCLRTCDPLVQDCDPGRGCYPVPTGFTCARVARTGGDRGFGEPCEFINSCKPGFFCASAPAVPGCATTRCCSEFCDISVTDSATQCSGATEGQICEPWYPDSSAAPPGYENLGGCAIPQ